MNQTVCHKNPTISTSSVARSLNDDPQTLKTNSPESPISPQYCTVKQIVEDRLFCFTESMLRYYILHAHKNGLTKALRRIGRKVLIRKDLLIIWIEKQARN
jgi:hypothetical protein